MEGGTVCVIQPVAGVKRQELHFSAVWQIRRFVDNEPSSLDRSLDGHRGKRTTGQAAQQALHATPPASLARRSRRW